MKIKFKYKDGFQGIGRKDNQEDNAVMSKDGRFFILCDGMGGHDKGEVASNTVCNALKDYFIQTPPDNYEISKEYFDNAIKFAYEKLDAQDKNPDSDKKMGTTMTCVYFGDNGVLVAHTGDSRVYQVRPSDYVQGNCSKAIKIKTKDHSLVRQLIDIGEITEQEAQTHPKRNIITKCMQPHEDYDMPEYDSYDVKPGDYFFLCSDGVLENVTEEILCEILSMDISDEQKKEKLYSVCDNKTRDNFTGILIHVESGELPSLFSSSPIIATDDDSDDGVNGKDVIGESHEYEATNANYFCNVIDWLKQNLNIVLIAVAALLCFYILASSMKSCDSNPKPPKTQTDGKNKEKKEEPKNKKDVELQKINDQYKKFNRKNLDCNIFQYYNPKTNEMCLVNGNSASVFKILDSTGRIVFDFKDSTLNDRHAQWDDFEIFQFTPNTESQDTVAKIVWTVERKTPTSPARTIEMEIKSNWKVIFNNPK